MLAAELQKGIQIEEILKQRSRIKFRTAKSYMWFTTTVDQVNEGEIILTLPEMFAAIEVIMEDRLYLKFCDESYEYSFEGEIVLVRIQLPQLVKIRILGEIKRLEKTEQSKREDTAILADVLVKNEVEVLHSYVCSIGNSSLKLISKNYIEEEEVDVCIVLPLRNVFDSAVKLTGRIVNAKVAQDYGEYEIAIVQIDKMHKERLERFLKTYLESTWAV